jgi:hypothetical protein
MQNNHIKNFALSIIVLFFVIFLYISIKAGMVSSKRQVGTNDGIYTNCVTTSPYISQKAIELTQGCKDKLCQAQKILDYVTTIPYVVNRFTAQKPQQTIQNNFGDCDDKSNLLISLLYALEMEAYFVLVPKHIFVIVSIDDERLSSKKGLWVEEKKYYILESTAKGSKVGFTLQYKLKDISTIINPFTNQKKELNQIAYKR